MAGSARHSLLIADPAAVAVARADEHQRSERPESTISRAFRKRRMEAMIEAAALTMRLCSAAAAARALQLRRASGRGLFDQHVSSGFDRADRDPGKLIVGGRDDDGVDIGRNAFRASR